MVNRHRLASFFAVSVFLLTIVLPYAQAQAAPGPTGSGTATSTSSSTLPATPSPSPSPGPMINVSGGGAIAFVAVGLGVVLVLGIATFVWNAWRASRRVDDLADKIMDSPYSAAEKEHMLTAIRVQHGVRGVTRGLIAVIILVLAGLALAATIFAGSADAANLRQTIMPAIFAVLATVVGFYFGSRTAQDSSPPSNQGAAAAATPANAPAASPSITALRDNKGPAGTPITIFGTGLTSPVTVLFGAKPAIGLTANADGSLTVTPPANGTGDTVMVAVITQTARSPAGPQAEFKYE